MADRYDDYERSSQGRRGDWREDRGGQDRGDFGRDDWDRNRNRGNWGNEHERWGRSDWAGNEPYGRENWRSYDQERYGRSGQYNDQYNRNNQWNQQRYGEQSHSGGREERDYQPHGSAWQRNNSTFFNRRQEEGPFGAGPQGFGQGYRSGEGGMGGYTGFGSGGSESYYGGAGSSGQNRGWGSSQSGYSGYGGQSNYSGDYGNQGRSSTYGNQSSGQYMGGGYGGSESQYGSSNLGQQQGRFHGRGPKGYQRSDDRIREDICERLTHHGDIDASEIEIQVRNGEVTLTGTVDERHHKRMAEEIAENVSGVKDVHNQVRVQDHAHQQSGTSSTGSHQQSTSTAGTSSSSQQTSSKEMAGQRK